MCRCSPSSSVRRRGPAAGLRQGHTATGEQCVHLLVPLDVAEVFGILFFEVFFWIFFGIFVGFSTNPIIAKFLCEMTAFESANFLHASEIPHEKINSPKFVAFQTDHGAHKLVHYPPINHFEHVGKIRLRLDASQDAKNTPLTDTLDFVQRIHNFKHSVDGDDNQYVLTSFDCSALYTNFTFSDLSKAFGYWRDEWKNTCLDNFEITLHERAYVRWLTEPIGGRWFGFIDSSFPFFNMQYNPEFSLGEVFLHLIFTHNIFKAPGSGIYRQAEGFSMGTNGAAAWANLALRCFKRLRQKALPCILLRFINDCACIHHRAHTPQITAMISSWYPPHLPFEVLALGVSANIIFLDLHVLNLHEPRYCTHFKPTNSATYICWSSNTPPGTKLGWTRGEGVRFLHMNSHERYFLAAVKRINGACRRLGYPKLLCSFLPVSWSEKHRYMTRNSKPKGMRVGSFLEFFSIHVWRVPYEACIPLTYGHPIHRLNQQIKKSIPGTKLFAVNRPKPNLRKRWHRALVTTLNDLGNVQPTADSLSMDASLLLNCRAAAENCNCSQSKNRSRTLPQYHVF